MKDIFNTTSILTLLWPIASCAAAWGIFVWALRQRDPLCDVVSGPVAPRACGNPAATSRASGSEPTTLPTMLDAPLPEGREFAVNGKDPHGKVVPDH